MQSLQELDAILYINLDIRRERGERLEKHLVEYGANIKKIHRIRAIGDADNGHKGCSKSHKKALEFATTEGFRNILILEDDAYFACDKTTLESYLETFTEFQQTESWDVFLLGGKIYEGEKTNHKDVTKVLRSVRSHGYITNNNYYESLIKNATNSIEKLNNLSYDPFVMYHVASSLDMTWEPLQKKDRWYAFWERGDSMICRQQKGFSDIALDIRSDRG